MSGAGAPDFFYREAQRLGFMARSAFKLLQMQQQYKLIKPGSSVLDLGCAPGAWLQVACQSLGPLTNGGMVLGIDLKVVGLIMREYAEQKVKVPAIHCDSRVKTVCANVMDLPRQQLRDYSPKQQGFSVILSDMCPLISGISTRDAALSAELGMRALDLSVGRLNNDIPKDEISQNGGILLPGGHLIIKLLESEDVKEFGQICKPLFKKASWLRPKATRSSSREIYLICQALK